MIRDITLLLVPKEKILIQQLKGKMISDMQIDLADTKEIKNNCYYNMCLSAKITCLEEEFAFYSEAVKTFDDEEFPRLHFNYFKDDSNDFKPLYTGSTRKEDYVEEIEVIHDHIEWMEHSGPWNLKIDVGILLTFKSNNYLFISLLDSSVGLMETYYGNDISWIFDREAILDIYMIEPESVSHLKRDRVKLTRETG
ncbi:hypothetical protein [Marininema halotolerans]|uniref:Uncharacterized protein n=1 Tax=Marininema halotolerans TaxID=1155944 RepID=A0A1I6UNU1_9BACL|nr:hypothetical protein [Marininema halotolerans]SFT03078.1 hypothetical protein SAMN05444972_11853 [Marininema halotolerans]